MCRFTYCDSDESLFKKYRMNGILLPVYKKDRRELLGHKIDEHTSKSVEKNSEKQIKRETRIIIRGNPMRIQKGKKHLGSNIYLEA